MDQNKTTRKPVCEKTGPCLFGERACPCDVLQLVDDTILTVRPPPEMKCSHKMRYGDAFLCTSPVRKEIYKRSQV